MSGLMPANVLSYLGQVVVPYISRPFPPQTTFNDFTVPTIWIDYLNKVASILVAKPFGVADWIPFASGSGVITAFGVDANTAPGTNPVTPTYGGLVTITGAQVAAGTTSNVIRTDSLAANTYTIQIQRSQAVASSTVGDNGVSHFNSAQFTVDANGFVALAGAIATLYTEDTGTATPSGGNLNVKGGTGIHTSGSGNTITISAIGGAFTWQDETTNFAALVNNGYFIAGNAIATLPAAPTNGDEIAFIVVGAFTVTVTANTGQTIKLAPITSAVAGTAVNTANGDALYLVYRSATTQWEGFFNGAWLVT